MQLHTGGGGGGGGVSASGGLSLCAQAGLDLDSLIWRSTGAKFYQVCVCSFDVCVQSQTPLLPELVTHEDL